MKRKEELIKSQSQLTPEQLSDLSWVGRELADLIKEEYVSEKGLFKLDSILDSLFSVREAYTKRLISMLRQGHMID